MMKRNEEKVPKFDEIIFENRNREYGAYDLRKRYKNVTSFSILGTVAIFTIIMLVISMTSKTAIGEEGKDVIIIIQPEKYRPPETEILKVEPPKGMIKQILNVTPKVVEDTAVQNVLMPITEELIGLAENGDTNDIAVVPGPPEDIVPPEKKVFIIVEEPAMYPGGDGALLEYIGKNIVYPEEAIANNIQGRVILKFVVTEDGSVGEIVLLKGVDPLLDKEAMRVIGTLPKFRAGRQSGTPVCVWYTVPVLFQLIQ
jgi:periplasmic protein TonB